MECRSEKPILFSGPMVRAILAGRKTQTRRVIDQDWLLRQQELAGIITNASDRANGWRQLVPFCPYGKPGCRLWVKETCWIFGQWHKNGWTKTGRQKWRFEAVGRDVRFDEQAKLPREQLGYHKRPSIFMPRWASRITLEVTDVRVQQVQEINAADCLAEGIPGLLSPTPEQNRKAAKWAGGFDAGACQLARVFYSELWDSINAKRGYGWEKNPWVWVVTFRRLA